jgi:hypothetical protein
LEGLYFIYILFKILISLEIEIAGTHFLGGVSTGVELRAFSLAVHSTT